MPRLNRYSPSDVHGRDIRVGDWVRVVSVPGSVAAMPRETRRVFSAAVGQTFQIEAFDGLGCAELDLTGKVGLDTIWIEPFCVQRVRRPRRYSARFRRIMAIRRRLERPRWSLRYLGKYRANENPQKLVARLSRGSVLGHGWYVVEKRREVHGTFFADDRKVSSKRRLEQWRMELKRTSVFESLRLGRVRLDI